MRRSEAPTAPLKSAHKSLTNLQNRAIHPKLRKVGLFGSTTHLLGSNTNPQFASSCLTTNNSIPCPAAASKVRLFGFASSPVYT